MSKKQMFDRWYDTLSEYEQSQLIAHILSTKLEATNEGLNVGPSGQRIVKGLFSGPAGYSPLVNCKLCGRPL